MPEITVEKVKEARELVRGVIHLTPLVYSRFFSNLTGAALHLKLENMQKTGSFKIRGAYNKIYSLTSGERAMGVVAASAGNHAQGVAYAASRAGLKSTIVMPENSPITKITATRGYGAEVVLWGNDYDQAYEKALEIRDLTGAAYVHGFDDPDVIAGQGTLGLEILDQLPGVEAVVAPVGGGGLLGGLAFALKSLRPGVKVYGVQSAASPAVYHNLKGGPVGEGASSASIADGIIVRRPGEITLDLIRKYVDDVVLVDDEEISQAILMLLERAKVVSEGAGAAGLAGLIHDRLKIEGLNVVAVISGGNIDVNLLSTIIERGLIRSGRRLRIKTVISDRPGSLRKIISLVSNLKVNIISIVHDRSDPGVPLREAEVEFVLETMDREHVRKVTSTIENAGYSLEIL